jgi:hypothetical protein
LAQDRLAAGQVCRLGFPEFTRFFNADCSAKLQLYSRSLYQLSYRGMMLTNSILQKWLAVVKEFVPCP